jgi:hypothetical protein
VGGIVGGSEKGLFEICFVPRFCSLRGIEIQQGPPNHSITDKVHIIQARRGSSLFPLYPHSRVLSGHLQQGHPSPNSVSIFHMHETRRKAGQLRSHPAQAVLVGHH